MLSLSHTQSTPKSCSFTRFFGGEEWFKNMTYRLLIHGPAPVSETDNRAYLPGFCVWVGRRNSSSKVVFCVCMDSWPPSGIAPLAFTARFHQHTGQSDRGGIYVQISSPNKRSISIILGMDRVSIDLVCATSLLSFNRWEFCGRFRRNIIPLISSALPSTFLYYFQAPMF